MTPSVISTLFTQSLRLGFAARRTFLICVFIGFSGAAFSQPSPTVTSTPSTVTVSEGDKAWSDFLKVVSSETKASAPASSKTALTAAAHPAPATWRSKADLAQSFYQKYPKHAKAGEAQKVEATMLLHAVFEGDASLAKRKNETVDAFIKDPAVSEELRVQVAGLRGFLDVMSKNPNPAQLWNELERSARQLIKDFPRQPQGYETFFTVASSVDDNRSKQLVAELLSMSLAPASVKQKAQLLSKQLALVGKPLKDLLPDALRANIKAGKPTIIYSWSIQSPESVRQAQSLAKTTLSAANIIGVNIDTDVGKARQAAVDAALPGSVVTDPAGPAGAVASALCISDNSTLYFVSANGTIADVRGADELQRKLTTYGL